MTMSTSQQNSSSPRRLVVSVSPATRKRTLCVGAGAMSGRCNNSPVNGLFCSGCADEIRFGGKKPEALRLADLPKTAQVIREVEEVVKPTAAQPAKLAPAQKSAPAPMVYRCHCGKPREPQYPRCNECHQNGVAAVKALNAILDFLYEDVCARREAARPQKSAPVVSAAAIAKREKAERERKERLQKEALAASQLAQRQAERAVTAAVLAFFKENVTESRHEVMIGEPGSKVLLSATRSSGSAQIVVRYVREGDSNVLRSLTVLSPEVAVALAKERERLAADARARAEAEIRAEAARRRLQPATPKPEEESSGKKGGKNKGEQKNGKGGNKKNGKK